MCPSGHVNRILADCVCLWLDKLVEYERATLSER